MVNFRKRVDRILGHSMREFGEQVIFFPRAGGVYKVRAIFNNDYQLIDPETEAVISGNQPALGVNLNDLKFDLCEGDRVQVRETTFSVYDKQEDGQGGATLLLHKTNASKQTKDTRVR